MFPADATMIPTAPYLASVEAFFMTRQILYPGGRLFAA